MKKLYKIRLQRHFFETCNNWMKWQDVSVDIKTLSPLGLRGSRPTSAVLCPWARHFTPRKYWLITQEAMAPSRHDWKIVDWDVKPQHNQPNPLGLSASAPGLYTCIKSWKNLYKIRRQRDSFETSNKWSKWQNVPVDIKILSPRGCQPLPQGYIQV